MMKEHIQKLVYGATRLALLAVGLAPLGFWAMLLGMDIMRSHGGAPGPDYAIWVMPTLLTAVPLAAVTGVWLLSRRASAEDLRYFTQIKFVFWSAAIWLCGVAPLMLGHTLDEKGAGLAFPLSLIMLGAAVFTQSNYRGFMFFMWISSMFALMLSGMPTC